MLLNVTNYLLQILQSFKAFKKIKTFKPTSLDLNENLKKKHVVNNVSFLKSFFYQKISELAIFKKQVVKKSNNFKSNFNIFFRPSDLSLNESESNFSFKKNIFFFLRKQKLFNKGRFSRNRQTYRTGAYWCLWVNILAVTGFYYWFYRFTMNFGYLWPFLALFVISFIFPRALKYNYFIIPNLIQSIFKLFLWFWIILSNYFHALKNWLHLFSEYSFFYFLQNFIFTFLFLFSKNVFKVNLKTDLMQKKYSHWNYFLPLGWIHRNHRLFFYKRLYYILFG